MLKSYGVGWGVAHKILVSAPVPLELILTGFDWVGAGPWGFGDLGRGLTIFCIILTIIRQLTLMAVPLAPPPLVPLAGQPLQQRHLNASRCDHK